MNNIMQDIRKKQDEIILMINSAFEEIINSVSQINGSTINESNEYEITYPLTNVSGFKGKKVIAVILNGNRIIVPTWKKVVEIILSDAIRDENNKKKLYNLCDKLLGRSRNRLSSNSENMRSSIELAPNLYIETHYDTETLMKLLLQILNEITYDYSKIKISIKN